jgi:flagellar basal-body rod modification protein FlgD
MQIDPRASTLAAAATDSSPATSAPVPTPSGLDLNDGNLFITLLTAQLQAQDPLNPMSPQEMVSQLTQVSSLQQLISMNQYLKDIAGVNSPAAATPAG